MLGKDKLVFDTTVSLTENDNVGAYLRASDGTLLTHTTIGGVEALDVNAAQFLGATTVAGIGLFAEDSAHASGDIGQQILVVRNDAGGSLVSADGDYSPLQVNSVGQLRVEADFSASFDFVYNEDSAHVSGSPGAFTLGVRNDARASFTSTDGDYSAFAVDAAGRILTTSEKAEDSAHVSGDYGNFALGVRNDTNAVLTSADGDYSPLAVDSAGRLKIVASVTSNTEYAEDSASASGDLGNFVLSVRQDALASSTSADGDYASFKVNNRGGLWAVPVGTVADDAPDTENPVKMGSRSISGAPAAISANNDRADLISDDYRRIYVNSGADIAVTHAAVTVGTTAVALPTTAAAGRRKIYIQNLSNKEIYIGGSGVTTANGLRIAAGAVFEDEVGDDVSLFGIAATAGNATRIFELS